MYNCHTIFNVYNFISFHTHTHTFVKPQSGYHNQDNKPILHQHPKSFLCPFVILSQTFLGSHTLPPTFPIYKQELILFFSLYNSLHFLKFYINERMHYSLTLFHSVYLRFIHAVACINTLFSFITD